MHAGRDRYAELMGHAQSPLVTLLLVNAAHDQELANALGTRAVHDGLTVSIELWHIDVVVAVHERDLGFSQEISMLGNQSKPRVRRRATLRQTHRLDTPLSASDA